MSRERDDKGKFRVWDKVRKVYLNDDHGFRLMYLRNGSTGFFNQDRWAFEQYTGLKDKNGIEIYEGDIFRNIINGGFWRVYWNEKDAAFWVDSGVAGCSLGEFDWDRSNRKYGFIRKNCEVIGNVHENQGLLGGDE